MWPPHSEGQGNSRRIWQIECVSLVHQQVFKVPHPHLRVLFLHLPSEVWWGSELIGAGTLQPNHQIWTWFSPYLLHETPRRWRTSVLPWSLRLSKHVQTPLMACSDSLGMEEEGMRGVWCLMAILRQVGSQDRGFRLRYSVQKLVRGNGVKSLL